MRCGHVITGGVCRTCTALLLTVFARRRSLGTGSEAPVVHDELACRHSDNCLTETGYGTRICMHCGVESFGGPFCKDSAFMYPRGHELTMRRKQPYTRAKRFRKYLMRACMSQGLSSVPDATWEYLSRFKPYTGPREILCRLKRSDLNNKCYDSLPIMTKHMCPHLRVPQLSHANVDSALKLFRQIEQGFPKESKFVSYLYLLEYILRHIGRSDMLPFLNRIQCPKRRRQYEERIRRGGEITSFAHPTTLRVGSG